jgi:hypothetical protein
MTPPGFLQHGKELAMAVSRGLHTNGDQRYNSSKYNAIVMLLVAVPPICTSYMLRHACSFKPLNYWPCSVYFTQPVLMLNIFWFFHVDITFYVISLMQVRSVAPRTCTACGGDRSRALLVNKSLNLNLNHEFTTATMSCISTTFRLRLIHFVYNSSANRLCRTAHGSLIPTGHWLHQWLQLSG